MDVPVGLVEWEVFVPERYSVRAVDGNVIDRVAYPSARPMSELESNRIGQGGTAGGVVGGVEERVNTVADDARGSQARGRDRQKPALEPPSQNVINLQRKTAGVLPVRVDIPRAGASHQFVKPLVVDQETLVSLNYKR